MAKRNYTKKSWVCKHGCPKGKAPCKHLERVLSDPNKGAMTLEAMKNHENVVMRTSQEYLHSNIDKKLASYGLPEHEIELILDRYVSNLSLAEIAERQGYLNKQEVWRLLKDITERLSKSPNFKKLLKGVSFE